MRRVTAIIASGILFLMFSGSAAHAGTLTDLNAQLASLNINATELSIPCNSATSQSTTDVSTVSSSRQALIMDEAKPVADKIAKDLEALAAAVATQESDESLTLNACTPVKLNQIDINEATDKLARIAALPSNSTEQMIAAAANGTFTLGQRCDWSPSVINGAYIETLGVDASWSTVPSIVGSYAYPNCNNGFGFGHWAIINLSPGSKYRWVLPSFSPAFIEPTLTMQDYFSQYPQQKQQINSDAQDAKASYTNVWENALSKDIQNSVNVVSPLITALDAQIKSQAAKYPKNASAYQQLISAEPVVPNLTSDNNVALTATTAYLDAVASFQVSAPTQLQNLIPKPIAIQCVNGKKTKKVVGLSPKCPAGYKKK